jgi:hypothetical protein
MHLDREADDLDAVRGQSTEVVRFLQARTADFPASAVAVTDRVIAAC